ncbi:MAG: ATP-binding cassette domain-containing protein [Prevotella sp.]|nr:ATP-binding cassette domain-containing protein [Prevotella sp.]
MQKTIRIEQGITRHPEWRMAQPVDFELESHEHLAVVGPNGGGKSMFIDIITGKHPLIGNGVDYDFHPSTKPFVSDNIKYIAFRDSYGGDNDRTYFLQQRWNQMEIGPETPTVARLLDMEYAFTGGESEERQQLRDHLYELFHIQQLLDKYIILLSSGEMRKFQLTRALLSNPRILILDNPFVGLDAETRGQLKTLLSVLSEEHYVQIILVLSKTDEIPEFITHVVQVENMIVGRKMSRELYLQQHQLLSASLEQQKRDAILHLPYHDNDYQAEEVIRMNKVSIRYGNRTILKDLDWTVRNGERWALSGQNGAGKSTLLSLVCADNPQSYACNITLFGRERGTGESIWDIKKHIGYVSPEMHRAYHRDIPAVRIVASGLKDTVGLYVKPDESDYAICRFWMEMFGLKGKEHISFQKLSSGEQRLVLLARAFVKDPELLILDEPLHGLDDKNRLMVKEIVDTFCKRRNKTMVYVTHYKEELPSCITHSLFLKRHE